MAENDAERAHHRPARRLQGRPGGEQDRHERSAARRRRAETDPQKESNLGDLVADAFLAGANRTAAADNRPLAKVPFSNGGGIRSSITAGDVAEKSTFDVLPFDNVLVDRPERRPRRA